MVQDVIMAEATGDFFRGESGNPFRAFVPVSDAPVAVYKINTVGDAVEYLFVIGVHIVS